MTNPIAEAIRVLRRRTNPRLPGDPPTQSDIWEALASALEELDERTRGEAGGSAKVFANCCPSCGVTDFRNMTCPKCGRTCSTGHIGLPHSPPPSREGVTVARLTAIIDEAFGLQPVQSPEGLLTLLESNLFELRRELESARARAGKLHAIARDAVYELRNSGNAYAGRFSDMVSEVMREPTPSAPTPAVVEKCCEQCGGQPMENGRCFDCGWVVGTPLAQREESPPRGSGGETTGAAESRPVVAGAVRPIEGSQPAEENSVRSWWDKYRIHESYDVQLPNTRQRIRDAYRFAHSEGAAEAGKRVAERVRRVVASLRSRARACQNAALGLASEQLDAEADDLESELEKTK